MSAFGRKKKGAGDFRRGTLVPKLRASAPLSKTLSLPSMAGEMSTVSPSTTRVTVTTAANFPSSSSSMGKQPTEN